jgi:Integrase zinc binding domain/RNase H-like domain found in reverse transcriptase
LRSLEDSVPERGEVALILEYEQTSQKLSLKAYSISEGELSNEKKRNLYLAEFLERENLTNFDRKKLESYFLAKYEREDKLETKEDVTVLANQKKYKPVAVKVRPIYAELPDQYRIKRNIQGDPLQGLPKLNPKPPDFVPTGRYTQERKEIIEQGHKEEFLWPEEKKLMHHLMMEQEKAFAWDDSERGSFRQDFFPPIIIPTVDHAPWVYRNIPIPAGIYNEVCKLVQKKIDAGVYEPSNASYRSRWFTVAKKDGKSLRIVHSLEPLNAVTIAHSGVPPVMEEIVSKFAGRACGGMLDLYVGYDERLLAPESRDLTTFQTPFGALRLVTLPMGWTNSVPIFHDDVTEILKAEIPEHTVPYIDDVPIRGPSSRYEIEPGKYETIPENPGIRKFVWEHMGNVNRILERMKYCGGTFSGKKTVVCAGAIEVLGHKCDFDGQKPTEDRIGVILKWDKCENQSQVRSFLGVVGVLRPYIPNYGIRAHELTKLLRKGNLFEWGPRQIAAMDLLKEGVAQAKAIRPLDYEGQGNIVLAVDTSYIAVGFYIYQEDVIDPKRHYYAKFGSRPLNDREARFSQPKRELFGLKEALRMNKRWLFGVRKLIVETDAKYIKGMLENPDMMPNATINRWIDEIKLYQFTIRHKAGATFGPDGLSRRPYQKDDPPIDIAEEDENWESEVPKFEIADISEPQPLVIKDFVDQIDSRGGYYQGIANSLDDFSKEIAKADAEREIEQDLLQKRLNLMDRELYSKHASYIQKIAVYTNTSKDDRINLPYEEEHRSVGAIQQDMYMPHIEKKLKDRTYTPQTFSEKELKRLERMVPRFIIYEQRLYRRGSQGPHRLYVPKERRTSMLTAAHDHNGHRGFFGTKSLLTQRFWWPEMEKDVKQFVKTCHVCQERQLQLVKIPPMKTHTPSIFEVIHADIMHMTPASNGHKYVVHGRDNLTSWAEGRALRDEKARSIALWLYEEILCRWGGLCLIVTDNGSSFKAASRWIEEKWGIKHITISPYNSKANGVIERPHWDIRQMLYKATGAANVSKWYWYLTAVLWADRISVRRRTGCSPYFMVTGAHPILPLDAAEATWLVKPPSGIMTEIELIGSRARALAKHGTHVAEMRRRIDQEKLKRLEQYERDFKAVIKDFEFVPGDLVMIRNTAVENSLDKKMKARYNGPMIVVRRNKGGSYIVAEMTGAVLQQKIARFRVVPYFARRKIDIPEGILKVIDADLETLDKIENLPEEESWSTRDYLMEDVQIIGEDNSDSEDEDIFVN